MTRTICLLIPVFQIFLIIDGFTEAKNQIILSRRPNKHFLPIAKESSKNDTELFLGSVVHKPNSNSIESGVFAESSEKKRNYFGTEDSEISTEPYTTLSTESPSTAQNSCTSNISKLIVTTRTSSMFICHIIYSCPNINASMLSIDFNVSLTDTCSVKNFRSDHLSTTINVSCRSIENYAGRDFYFTIYSNSSDSNPVVRKQTFTVTLEPLPLNTSTFDITINDDITNATIYIENCTQISPIEYLLFRCDINDNDNQTVPDNCTLYCSNITAGSLYNSSLVRLAIPKKDQPVAISRKSFEEEIIYRSFKTRLDTIKGIQFICDKNTSAINYTRPRGNFDEIHFTYSAQDQNCLNFPKNFTKIINSSEVEHIQLDPIAKGVLYRGQATTVKSGFQNETSVIYSFRTSIEPVVYRSSEGHFSSTSQFILHVTQQSDFDSIESNCRSVSNQSYPCTNLSVEVGSCSTRFTHYGISGCSYSCYFVTKKNNYDSKDSPIFQFDVYPPRPNISKSTASARWIVITWTLPTSAVYMVHYLLTWNVSNTKIVGRNSTMYNITDLLPNRNYVFQIKLVSHYISESTNQYVRTLEDAPEKPTENDIKNGIIPLNDSDLSTSEQYAINISSKLFSNENGQITKLKVYVRQDEENQSSEPSGMGTYDDALKNQSVDYIAYIIRMPPASQSCPQLMCSIPIVLGNESSCKFSSDPQEACNKRLRSNKSYRIVVSGCTKAGCTSVLSNAFQTKKPLPKSTSKGWIAVIPILLIVSIVVVTLVWKRETVRKFFNQGNGTETEKQDVVIEQEIIMRPKPLIEYLNLTVDDSIEIYDEFKELEKYSPKADPSHYDLYLANFDRYGNISARGPWSQTAIYLNDPRRPHDYINANFIRGLNAERDYIACQGPLHCTCEDFWEMILQYKEKCHRYFPKHLGDRKTYNNIGITVRVIGIDAFDELEVRKISIATVDSREHHLVHYHFTGWPDFNAVKPRELINLIKYINGSQAKTPRSNSNAPMVVHCSAGVGRTGTYIAVDTIISILDGHPPHELRRLKLDVMGIVYKMRLARTHMVQTKEQYFSVNICVGEYLRLHNELNTEANVYEKYTSQYEDASPIKITDQSVTYVPRK